MNNWAKITRITYKKWRDDKIRGEGDIVGHNDEDQCADYEICTTTMQTVGQSASHSGSTKTKDTFTVEEAVEVIGFGKFQWKLSFLTGLSWMADAMEMMVLSILAPQLYCEWRLPSFKVAFITSVVFIGMGISSSIWGNVSDKYGRKIGLTLSVVWTTYYGLLSAFSPTYGWIVVLRALVGFGIGGFPQSVTLYSEFLPMKKRAASIMLIQIFWATGAVFEVLLAMWIMPTLGWRWLLSLSIIPMLVFDIFCFWLPESARFDVLVGNRQKALATLTRIAADNGQTMPQGTLTANKQEGRGRIKDLFTPYYRRTTLLVWFIWFAYGFVYYGIVLLTTELFQAGDVCDVTPGAKTELSCSLECKYLTFADYKDLLLTSLAEFPGLFIILLMIDWIGRRKSMALCFIMFTLCILPLYACIGRIALTVLISIARAFIAGGYQMVFVYTPEVFPTEMRAIGMGTSSGMGRVSALLTPFVSQVLLKESVYLALSVYCACCLLAAGASLCLPIETSGRGLQESSQPTGEQEIPRTSWPNGTAPIPDTSYGCCNQEQAGSAK